MPYLKETQKRFKEKRSDLPNIAQRLDGMARFYHDFHYNEGNENSDYSVQDLTYLLKLQKGKEFVHE